MFDENRAMAAFGVTPIVCCPESVAAACNGGNNLEDVFVAKLNATGNGLIFSTFIGGGGTDRGQSLCLDAENNIYVTGI